MARHSEMVGTNALVLKKVMKEATDLFSGTVLGRSIYILWTNHSKRSKSHVSENFAGQFQIECVGEGL